MYAKHRTIGALVRNVRFFTGTAQRSARTHYDSLGVQRNATQNEIKAAYYKLSMTYHPDKNRGSEDASNKFKDITAAYEILGNYKLRRLYDRGILHTAGPQYTKDDASGFTAQPDDPKMGFYRSREVRRKVPTPTGKTPIYDFDEWSRAHYGYQFNEQQTLKRRTAMYRAKKKQMEYDTKNEAVLIGLAAFALVFTMFYARRTDYDEVKRPPTKPPTTTA